MVLRALLFGGLVALLPLMLGAVKLSAALRRRRVLAGAPEPRLAQGQRTLLFFTGEHCSICKHRQKPAIETVRAQVDGLRVVEIDAVAESELARRFDVLSLPTTVVLTPDGRVGAVNYGFAPGDRLRAQVAALA